MKAGKEQQLLFRCCVDGDHWPVGNLHPLVGTACCDDVGVTTGDGADLLGSGTAPATLRKGWVREPQRMGLHHRRSAWFGSQ